MPVEFIYLASGSPRRSELLRQIGVPFRQLQPAVDESLLSGEAPPDYVARLARAKAAAGLQLRPPLSNEPVLAADTTVVLDGKVFGKPTSRDMCIAMLSELGGRVHRVLTAITLATAAAAETRLSTSEVRLRKITVDEAARYWQSGEPRDKAGGYAVQGFGAIFVESIAGSFSGVMGLPLYETAELLDNAGAPRWQAA
jgi:septum formation protein